MTGVDESGITFMVGASGAEVSIPSDSQNFNYNDKNSILATERNTIRPKILNSIVNSELDKIEVASEKVILTPTDDSPTKIVENSFSR